MPPSEANARRSSNPRWLRPCAALLFCMCAMAPVQGWAAMSCNVASTGVNFGPYDPLAASPDDATGTIDVTCTRQIWVDPFRIDYTLALSPGGSGNFSPRRLSAGTNRLNYNLYRDAARAQVWGSGASSTFTVAGTANFNWFQTSQTNNHDLYGRVPAAQEPAPGNYGDSIVVTITF